MTTWINSQFPRPDFHRQVQRHYGLQDTGFPRNVKPFIETLRATNPVRQSRASSREASLAWGRATVTAKRRQRDQTLCD